MSAAREKDQADFDLEAFIDLFDEALTSDDPSVQKTLQHLMVICALARNHDNHNARTGPLRRLYDDQANILRRLERIEIQHSQQGLGKGWPGGGYNPSAPYGPGTVPLTQPHTAPNPGGGTWPSPNVIWTTSNPGTTWSSTLGGGGPGPTAIAKSSTSYAWDPVDTSKIAKAINGGKIAERVEELLKDPKYNGSSLGTMDVKIT